MHENNVAHQYVLILHPSTYLTWPAIRDCTPGNIMLDPSNMYPESFHPADIRRSKDFRRKAKWYTRTRRPTNTSLSTLACPVGMILPIGHYSTNRTVAVTSRPRNFRRG